MTSPRTVWMPGGIRIEIQLGGEDTDGAFCLLVDEPPAGWSIPAHRHRDEAETIHVVAGTFDVEVDGVRSRLGPGETVHVPRGTVHSSANVGVEPGRRVVVFSPAGIERFFREAGAETPGAVGDPRDGLASAVRHGWEFVDPA